MKNKALDKAIKYFGSQYALAKALGIKPGHVWYWANKSGVVPAAHCAAIERLTGKLVTRRQLNDKFPWAD